MNCSALLVPPAVVTVTLTVPLPAGDVAVHEVVAHDAPVALTVPKATLAGKRNDYEYSVVEQLGFILPP